jgi:hypothetical protein
MRKVAILIASALCFSSFVNPANAVTKATTVTAAFKKMASTAGESLDSLELKYESDIDLLDQTLLEASRVANSNYDQDLLSATTMYAPQIASANIRLEAAKTLFESNSQLTIFQGLSTYQNADRIYSLLICPDSTLPNGADWMEIAKRYCVNVNNKPRPGDVSTKTNSKNTVGGEDWQTKDVASIQYMNADNQYLQFAITNGWLVPLNPVVFDSSRIAIKTETTNVASLIQQNGKARTSALEKRDRAVSVATKARQDAVDLIDEAFNKAKTNLENQETAAALALTAAKRASKDPTIFDVAFVIAYKFDYNQKKLDEIADAAWTGDWTYRTIDSIIKVNKLAILGDGVSKKYTMKAAKAFNEKVGNAFTNEVDFRAALKFVVATYKQTTKVSLKF